MGDYSSHDYDAEDRAIGCLLVILIGLAVLAILGAIVRGV